MADDEELENEGMSMEFAESMTLGSNRPPGGGDSRPSARSSCVQDVLEKFGNQSIYYRNSIRAMPTTQEENKQEESKQTRNPTEISFAESVKLALSEIIDAVKQEDQELA